MSSRDEEAATPDAARPARFAAIRDHLGKTQRQMGELVGVSSQSWQDYEAGTAIPKVSVYEALARLGFNPDWLVGRDARMLKSDIAIPVHEGVAPGQNPQIAYHLA